MPTNITRSWGRRTSASARRVEALVRLPHDLVMFVGQAWLAPGTEVTADHEHDAYEWWPRDVADWPEEAHADLRQIPVLLGEASRS